MLCVWYISGSEMWFQGRSGGSAGGLGGVFAHFWRGCPSEWLWPLRSNSIFVVRMIYKYFPLVSPRARYLTKGKLSLKWGHESQVCEMPACLHTHTKTHTPLCSSSKPNNPDQVNRSTSHENTNWNAGNLQSLWICIKDTKRQSSPNEAKITERQTLWHTDNLKTTLCI